MSNSDKTIVANFSVSPDQTGISDVPGITVLLNKKTLLKQEDSANSGSSVELAIQALLEAGAISGAFLGAEANGSATFRTQSTFGLSGHEEIFRGVVWSSKLGEAGAETLTQLLKTGALEMGPLSAVGITRAIRAAFAVQNKQWLTLIRSGSVERPDGIIAVVSPMRLGTILSQVQKILQKTISVTRKTA